MIAPEIEIIQTIQAQPDYFVLSATPNDDGFPDEIHRTPVIAWAIESETYAPYPITLDGLQVQVPVERPDGQVECAESCCYEDAGYWLIDMQVNYAAARRLGKGVPFFSDRGIERDHLVDHIARREAEYEEKRRIERQEAMAYVVQRDAEYEEERRIEREEASAYVVQRDAEYEEERRIKLTEADGSADNRTQ